MKVGIIFNSFVGYGGAQTCVAVLIEALNEKGIQPVLLSEQQVNSSLYPERKLQFSVEKIKYSISSEFYYKHFKYLSKVYEFIFYFKTSNLKSDFDFLYILEPNVIVNTKTPYLIYYHFSPIARGYIKNSRNAKLKYYAYQNLIKYLFPIFELRGNGSAVINSAFSQGYYKKNIKKEIKVVYPPCYNLKKVAIENKKAKSVLFFSRISANKRPEIVLKLAQKFKDYSFTIAGSAIKTDLEYCKELMKQLNTLNLSNVTIVPNPSDEVKERLLRESEYFIFGAYNEHFGIVTVEAINYSCIPFVHNSGGQIEIVNTSELRFEYENIEDKFNKITKLTDLEKKEILFNLHENIAKFSDWEFKNAMLSYLKND